MGQNSSVAANFKPEPRPKLLLEIELLGFDLFRPSAILASTSLNSDFLFELCSHQKDG